MKRWTLLFLILMRTPALADEPVPNADEPVPPADQPVPAESVPAADQPAAEPVPTADQPPAEELEPSAHDVGTAPPPGRESGRLDSTDKDSPGRVVGRTVLFVPRAALEIVFAPVRAGVWAVGRYDLLDRYYALFYDETQTYGLRPLLRLDASYGLSLGAVAEHKDLFGDREHLELRAGFGGGIRAAYGARIDSGQRFGPHVAELRGVYYDRPHDAFYGFGNADDAIKTTHEQELRRAGLTLDFLVAPAFHVIPSGAISDLEFGPGDMGTSIEMVYPTDMLGGWPGVENLYGELELRYDSRRPRSIWDSRAFLAAGSLAAVYAGWVHQLNEASDYARVGFALQQFIPITLGPRAFVLRARGETVSGSLEEVAFTELPQIGGVPTLRGYPRDRFRDRVAAVGSVDYVFDLSHELGASLFVDAGRVYSALDELSFSNMRVGFGLGLQLRSNCCFVGQMTIASSIDGGAFVNLSTESDFDIESRMVRQ